MIRTIVYRDNKLVSGSMSLEQVVETRANPASMVWIDLAESADDEVRHVLGDVFSVHPLTIEDCLQDTPLPKVETYEDYLYMVLHAVDYSRKGKFTTTEVDFIIGTNFLITVHRHPLKPIDVARDRCLRAPATLVRGPDRLAHNVLDLLVDYYRPALAELRTEVETLEERVLHNEKKPLAQQIMELREDLAALREIIRPQRELVAELVLGRSRFFRKTMLPYLRDLQDELVRIEEMSASWSDETILLFRVFLNRSSHEANRGIRVLTALTAVTIPLLIVGGWYGMNFPGMPEIYSPAGYWIALGITSACTLALFVLLKRRRWF
jgi:magnesium transporter